VGSEMCIRDRAKAVDLQQSDEKTTA